VEAITCDYDIQKKLANTIQGAVFKAMHRDTGTMVAIKAVSQRAVKEQTTLDGKVVVAENVLDELMILNELQGISGMIELFDALEDGQCYFLVTRFESGGDLFDFLAEAPRLTEQEIKHIFRCVLEPVSKLHSMDICHLDLSLENVFISEEGEAKLADFGLARIRRHGTKIFSKIPCGKPKYMAPEIAEGEEFDGFKADVYSLGIMLFCLMYNSHPYEVPNKEHSGYFLIRHGSIRKFLDFQGFSGKYSSQVEALLEELLCPEDERISLSILMEHPWVHSS
jgi:serine/threonine protein kinase